MWDDDVDWMSADKEDREETGRMLCDDPRAFPSWWRTTTSELLSMAIVNGENTFSGDSE